MKKIISLIFMFMICININAEKKVSEYSMSFFGQKSFDVETTEVSNGKFTYYVYTESKEKDGICGFQLKSTNIQGVIDALRQIEPKYEEWSKTAKDNNVTDYDKSFEIALPKMDCYFKYGSKWCFDYGWKVKPYFKVTSNGDCLVVISVGKLTASSNQFMHHQGMMMAFASVEEIEEFIKAIDSTHALENTSETQKKDDLFK